MKTSAIITLSLILLVGIFSCKKDDDMKKCEDNPDKKSDVRLLPYLFATGSYWVYQEQSSLALDSQRVIEGLKASYPVIQYCQYMVDGWHSRVVSYQGSATDTFTYTAGADINRQIHASSYSLQDSIYRKSVLLVLDFLPGQIDTSGIQFISKLGSLTVSGSIYSNVLAFHLPLQTLAPNGFKYESDLYFAPDFGLIRKVEYNTPNGIQTWDLLRYRAIPIED